MNPYRFRVWDIELVEFTTNPVWMSSDGSLLFDAGKDYVVPADPERFIVMWYTGFRDRNKVEIFEKDIIHIDGILSADVITQVKWDTGSFSANIDLNYRRLSHWAMEGVEVIGNVLQNENLLR
jgi:hypothetical protein